MRRAKASGASLKALIGFLRSTLLLLMRRLKSGVMVILIEHPRLGQRPQRTNQSSQSAERNGKAKQQQNVVKNLVHASTA
jgi:hypothetical protein